MQISGSVMRLGLAAAAVSGLATGALAAPSQKPLNFVFILADDYGWTDLGCYGSKFYETPNLDRLAKTGMRFTNAYAACPVCSPSRAAIMSGKYPARLGTTDYFGAGHKARRRRGETLDPAPYVDHLPLQEVTIAEALKQAGYHTFFAGKWHLGGKGYWPENQGFDVNKGGWTRGGPYGGKKYFSPYGNPRLKDGPPGEYLPLRLGNEAASFIRQHKDGPFFVDLSFYSVHQPIMTTPQLKTKYSNKCKKVGLKPNIAKDAKGRFSTVQCNPVYAGLIESMDKAIGNVLDTLEELGLADNTIVIFTSDNGGLSTAQGFPTSNLPLRGGKGWTYEGGIRVPLIIRWPGHTRIGSVCGTPVIGTDYYPTMLQMAGLPLRPKQHADGVSLVPLLDGGKIPSRNLYWHYPHYGDQGGSPSGCIRMGDWKLIQWFGPNGHVELYNLAKDLGEQHDLAKEQPERTAEMLKTLQEWQKQMNAKFPTPAASQPPKKKPHKKHPAKF